MNNIWHQQYAKGHQDGFAEGRALELRRKATDLLYTLMIGMAIGLTIGYGVWGT